jgi:HAMP domain-containing protein
MLRKLKLGLKFTLILTVIFICSTLLSGLLLARASHKQAERQIAAQATMLMEMVNAVRSYTNHEVQPLLLDRLDSESTKFVSEAIPSYAARQSFENLRKQEAYKDYFYKDASINPTNSRDQANEFEATLLEKFQDNSSLEELSGFHELSGKQLFYVARPLVLKEQSCLRCHSDPKLAPKSQLAAYGADHGFGWRLNQIVAVQTVYIKGEEVFQSYNQQLFLMIGLFAVIFAVVILAINTLLNRMVVQPITPMARLTQRISHDQYSTDRTEEADLRKLDKVAKRSDELGQLAALFRQMTSALSDREQSAKQLMQQLRRESDSAKKAMAATRFNGGVDVAALIQRSRRSRFQSELQPQALNDLLRQVSCFQSFSKAEIEKLIHSGYQTQLATGEFICHEDDPGDSFYIILSGSVEVYLEKLQKELRTLATGDFFGELSLLLGIPRTATVRTLETTTLFVVDQTRFQPLIQNNQQLADSIAQALNDRQAELEQRKDLLRKHGLLDDEKTFSQNPMFWIRDRLKKTFKL